jgi:hypothetical protein
MGAGPLGARMLAITRRCNIRRPRGLFSLCSAAIVGAMRAATPEEVAESLSFALLFNGRKRYRQADEIMAKIVAEHLVQHLQRCGYVLMKEPPGPGHSTPGTRALPIS